MDDHGLKDLINTDHDFVLGKLKDLESQITPTYDDGVKNLVNTNHDFIKFNLEHNWVRIFIWN